MANGNHVPKPEPIWIALGICMAAIAVALGSKRRAVMLDEIRRLTAQHRERAGVIAFGELRNHRRDLPHAIRGGAAWLLRLVDELDDGAGREDL